MYVGRLAIEKSIDVLIDMHKDIVRKNKNAKLLIVGFGPDEEKFKKLAAKNKISDNVIFTGKVPYDDVPNYYHLTNIFATASLSETQGLTIVEAMAASKAVIAINDECFRSVIVNNYNGYIYNNKKDYKKIIEDLMADNKKVRYLGAQARISSETYSSQFYAERVLNVYEMALKNSGKTKRTLIERIKDVIKKDKQSN